MGSVSAPRRRRHSNFDFAAKRRREIELHARHVGAAQTADFSRWLLMLALQSGCQGSSLLPHADCLAPRCPDHRGRRHRHRRRSGRHSALLVSGSGGEVSGRDLSAADNAWDHNHWCLRLLQAQADGSAPAQGSVVAGATLTQATLSCRPPPPLPPPPPPPSPKQMTLRGPQISHFL